MTTTTTSTTTTEPMITRTEEILVLYGSQTGNSEQAAKDLCEQIPTRLSPGQIRSLVTVGKTDDTHSNEIIHVHARHMQLDDFLEIERAQWTRLIVIIVSSYGVGQAPLGAYRFRELCDAWTDNNESSSTSDLLQGVYFAMCGLGDSKYTTFFRNPTKIHQALIQVGAKRVGEFGRADASGTGQDHTIEAIEAWMEHIWKHLAHVIVKPPLPPERLAQMQQDTVALCRKINPEFPVDENENDVSKANRTASGIIQQWGLALFMTILAVVVYRYFWKI
jgi:sulfite reductase alpha subunit-like flavoprotein